MQRNRIVFSMILLVLFIQGTNAQISYGGEPLTFTSSLLKSSSTIEFIEMPPFHPDSLLVPEGAIDEEMRTSFSFAHKYYTNIRKGVDGTETLLPDGTKLWQVGILSQGAYSINLLFTEFDIPPGGKLFLYNTDRTHVIGSFDHRNNSPKKILPIRPVAGEAIIIEYSEPADAEYEGRLTIGEVNHDYRDILNSDFLKREPAVDQSSYSCMPDVWCAEVDETIVRSSVLLMINGTTACSGTMINNTENDETPYLLTAVHCLNPTATFPQNEDYYIERAGTIITFFNYNRPVCGSTMKGTENMSVAIAHPKAIIERKDIALLELQEKPPVYYNVYYAGWNRASSANNPPYTNIHHPAGGLKKYGRVDQALALSTWAMSQFDSNSHWRVPGWTIGSTHEGSSGSALFDRDNLIIGSLTGGSSACNSANPNHQSDYFSALYKGWETGDPANQLKTYLDPNQTGVTRLVGYDPHANHPLIRMSNAPFDTAGALELAVYPAPGDGYVFGNSNLPPVEFAEAFEMDTTCTLQGVYVWIPPMPYSYTTGVEFGIYSGDDAPDELLETQVFRPQYLNYRTVGDGKDFVLDPVNTNQVPTEQFIRFDDLYVGRRFYVAYKINDSTTNRFAVYNSTPLSDHPVNTAWIKDENGTWYPADRYPAYPVSTSLAIQPLLQHAEDLSVPHIEAPDKNFFVYLKEDNQLWLPETETHGQLSVYAINGQLLFRYTVAAGTQSVQLEPLASGSMLIVRLVSDNEVYTGKIIH